MQFVGRLYALRQLGRPSRPSLWSMSEIHGSLPLHFSILILFFMLTILPKPLFISLWLISPEITPAIRTTWLVVFIVFNFPLVIVDCFRFASLLGHRQYPHLLGWRGNRRNGMILSVCSLLVQGLVMIPPLLCARGHLYPIWWAPVALTLLLPLATPTLVLLQVRQDRKSYKPIVLPPDGPQEAEGDMQWGGKFKVAYEEQILASAVVAHVQNVEDEGTAPASVPHADVENRSSADLIQMVVEDSPDSATRPIGKDNLIGEVDVWRLRQEFGVNPVPQDGRFVAYAYCMALAVPKWAFLVANRRRYEKWLLTANITLHCIHVGAFAIHYVAAQIRKTRDLRSSIRTLAIWEYAYTVLARVAFFAAGVQTALFAAVVILVLFDGGGTSKSLLVLLPLDLMLLGCAAAAVVSDLYRYEDGVREDPWQMKDESRPSAR